jgi:Rieske Fe-S protein
MKQVHDHPDPSLDGQLTPTRRRFLGWLVAGINVVVAAVVVGPVLGYIGSPLRRKAKARWVPVLDESELAVGQTREASFVLRIKDGFAETDQKYSVFLHRTPERIMAFDPACTHLGCRVKWMGDKDRYFCPCHGGVFNADGKVVSGPPPKPLEEYPVKVEDGRIWIQKKV